MWPSDRCFRCNMTKQSYQFPTPHSPISAFFTLANGTTIYFHTLKALFDPFLSPISLTSRASLNSLALPIKYISKLTQPQPLNWSHTSTLSLQPVLHRNHSQKQSPCFNPGSRFASAHRIGSEGLTVVPRCLSMQPRHSRQLPLPPLAHHSPHVALPILAFLCPEGTKVFLFSQPVWASLP